MNPILNPNGPLLLFVPLALSLLALLVAWLGRVHWPEVAPEFASRMLWLENEAARQASTPAPEPAPASPNSAPSPLETMRNGVVDDIDYISDLLHQILRAAGASEQPFLSARAEFAQSAQRVEAATSETEIQTLLLGYLGLLPPFLRSLLSRCDLDLNPGQTNRSIERALRSMLTYAGLQMIAPAPGDAFSPVLHTRLGVTPGTLAQRGTIGQVRCRGLHDADGNVLLKAEILEFD